MAPAGRRHARAGLPRLDGAWPWQLLPVEFVWIGFMLPLGYVVGPPRSVLALWRGRRLVRMLRLTNATNSCSNWNCSNFASRGLR